MPQNTELPLWKAGYPITAPAQKPGGVTISTALWAHAVPNKPQWTGTQLAAEEAKSDDGTPVTEQVEEEPTEETEEDDSGEEETTRHHGKRPRRRK